LAIKTSHGLQFEKVQVWQLEFGKGRHQQNYQKKNGKGLKEMLP